MKKRRWKSEQEIEAAIQRAKAEMVKLSEAADQEEAYAMSVFKAQKIDEMERAKYAHAQCQKMRRKVKSLETVRLPKLKELMGAMLTETMPFVPDRTVVES